MRFAVEMDHNESGATFTPEQGRGYVAFGVRRKKGPGLDSRLARARGVRLRHMLKLLLLISLLAPGASHSCCPRALRDAGL